MFDLWIRLQNEAVSHFINFNIGQRLILTQIDLGKLLFTIKDEILSKIIYSESHIIVISLIKKCSEIYNNLVRFNLLNKLTINSGKLNLIMQRFILTLIKWTFI